MPRRVCALRECAAPSRLVLGNLQSLVEIGLVVPAAPPLEHGAERSLLVAGRRDRPGVLGAPGGEGAEQHDDPRHVLVGHVVARGQVERLGVLGELGPGVEEAQVGDGVVGLGLDDAVLLRARRGRRRRASSELWEGCVIPDDGRWMVQEERRALMLTRT